MVNANDIFTNIAAGHVTSGGTTAPAAGTTESWTVVTDLGTFPAAQNTASAPTQFRVIDPATDYSEVVLVTNVSGTAWSVTRGADGTTPVAHASGFTVWMVVVPQWANAAGQSFGSAQSVTPAGCLAETMPRSAISGSGNGAILTASLYMYATYIPINTKVSAVNFYNGTTAAVSPTHQWWGLADAGGMQRAHTVDGTSAALAATTAYTKTFVTPYTTTYSGTYFVLQSITASTPPTAYGGLGGFGGITGADPLWFESATAGATPGTDGTTTYATTGGSGHPPHYFYLT